MTFLPLLAVGILMKFVAVLFVMVSIILILVILIQKGRGGGLSGAFGGGMASGLLGSKTGDFLTWVTIGLVAVFLGLAVLMAKYFRPSVSDYGAETPAATTSEAGSAAPTPAEQPAGSTPAAGTEQTAPAPEPTPTEPATTQSGSQQPTDATGAGGSGVE